MSRKRHQQGNLKVVRGRWIAPWWKGGHRRNKALGKAGKITKSQAQDKLAEILAPIYTQQQGPNRRLEIRWFCEPGIFAVGLPQVEELNNGLQLRPLGASRYLRIR